MLVECTGPFTFSIGDTSSFDDYVSGGIAHQVKMPKTVDFVSISLILTFFNAAFVLSLFNDTPVTINLCIILGRGSLMVMPVNANWRMESSVIHFKLRKPPIN